MAKPTSRQELVEYALRRLGAPVLEINVADEQLDDILDDTIQYFQERHYDGQPFWEPQRGSLSRVRRSCGRIGR